MKITEAWFHFQKVHVADSGQQIDNLMKGNVHRDKMWERGRVKGKGELGGRGMNVWVRSDSDYIVFQRCYFSLTEWLGIFNLEEYTGYKN